MSKDDIVFCIDTSAFVDLHKYYPEQRVPELWNELSRLFQSGNVISHKIVFDELTTNSKRPSPLSKWVTARRNNFFDMTSNQAIHVDSIIKEFPGLIDPTYEKDQADPWLIALVLERRSQNNMFTQSQNYTVVSQENVLSSNKIPAVCKRHNIDHYDLFQFFDKNGWKLGFQKLELSTASKGIVCG